MRSIGGEEEAATAAAAFVGDPSSGDAAIAITDCKVGIAREASSATFEMRRWKPLHILQCQYLFSPLECTAMHSSRVTHSCQQKRSNY